VELVNFIKDIKFFILLDSPYQIYDTEIENGSYFAYPGFELYILTRRFNPYFKFKNNFYNKNSSEEEKGNS